MKKEDSKVFVLSLNYQFANLLAINSKFISELLGKRVMLVENDILQVDAIVITGVLILLTITSFVNRKHREGDDDIAKPRKAAFYLIIPFSVSAILLLIQNIVSLGFDVIIASSIVTVIGFIYLIVVVTAIAKLKD